MNTTESTTPALNRAGRRSLARTGSALGGAGVLVAGSAAALLTASLGRPALLRPSPSTQTQTALLLPATAATTLPATADCATQLHLL